MPVYTYLCESCGVRFEKTQKFEDKALTRCPECRKGHVHRVMQPSAIVFKGSGWYATDSKSSSGAGKRANKSEAEGGEKAATAEKSDNGDKGEKSGKADKPEKAESKPAKKEASAASDD